MCSYSEWYHACLACYGKVDCVEDPIGYCTQCGMSQLFDLCKPEASGKLLINVGTEYLQLSAFKCILAEIVQDKDITVPSLLKAKPFTFVYENNVIVSISCSVGAGGGGGRGGGGTGVGDSTGGDDGGGSE